MVHGARVLACGQERGFVHEVRQFRAGEAGCTLGEHFQLHVVGQRDVLRVHPQDPFAALHIGAVHDHLTVEPAGAHERRVQHVRTVGCGDDDHAAVLFEAVHLHEELVQRLFAFIVTAAEACAAVTADGVDLVDEDDARGALLSLVEQVAHAACADADEHLDEIRTGDREERHARFAGDGTGEEGLAGARRAEQQDAARDLAAEFLELARLLQELDDLHQFLLRFIRAGDVDEGDLGCAFVQHLRAALAEGEDPLRTRALHPAHDDEPDHEEQDPREGAQQRAQPGVVLLLDGEVDLVVVPALDHLAVHDRAA